MRSDHSTSNQIAASQPSPEELFLRRERLRRIEDVFFRYLPEEQVAVMLALYVNDLTEAQTAEALGVTPALVKRRMYDALAALREVPGLQQLLRGE